MNSSTRQRPFMIGGPIFVGIVAAYYGAQHVRGVDFLLLHVGGIAVGAGLGELVRFLRARRS